MSTATTTHRNTKYCTAIKSRLKLLGHASNAELLGTLRKTYPELSATTVHRATARLASREKIAVAPSKLDGSIRYEANITPHDHFQCSSCGILKDTNIKEKIVPILKSTIDDCEVSGQLTINGICKKCSKK